MLQLGVALYILVFGTSTSYGFSLGKEVGSCFSGGCDAVWYMNRRIDDGIRSKSESLVGPAKQAFLEVMQILFDQKLTPLLGKIDETAKARLDQVQSIVKQTTDHVDDLIDKAARAAKEVTSDSIDEIKTKIIDSTFDRAEKLVNDIGNQLISVIEKFDCEIEGNRDAVIIWAKNLLTFPNPFSTCRKKYGFTFSTPASDDFINIYRITLCEYEADLNKSQSVSDIKFNYNRMSLLSRRFACIVGDSSRTSIDQDGRFFSDMFNIWDLASGRKR